MPDPQTPQPDELQPPAPPAESAASAPEPTPKDRMDTGCLLLLAICFIGVFLLPAVIMLGGAALLIPAILALLTAVITPLLNPAEKMAPRARWTGRIIIFLVICILLAAGLFFLWGGAGGALIRE